MTIAGVCRLLMVAGCVVAAGGCAVGEYYDKWFGNAPAIKPASLVTFNASVAARIVWQGNVGSAEKHVFSPAMRGGSIVAAGANGQISLFDTASGKLLGRVDTKNRFTGGMGSDGNVMFAGTAAGEVLAFDSGGKVLWKSALSSEVLSAPQAGAGVIVVRSGDGRIYGLDSANGSRKWVYQRTLPTLTVRSHAGVVISRDVVYAGFPGGRLVAMGLANGNVGWESAVALPKGSTELERVADVSGPPATDGRQVCAAAYQGRVACFDVLKGATLWARDVSSIAGLAMDGRNVYVADEKSALLAFDKASGASLWKQDKLYGRNISGPAAIGRYVVVGDYQGYVHVLSNDDGSFLARIATDGSAIIAQPVVIDGKVLVQTRGGGVYMIAI